MKTLTIRNDQICLFIWLPFLLFLLACRLTMQTPVSPTPQTQATIETLMIENTRLINQLATAEAQVQLATIQAPTATVKPTPIPTLSLPTPTYTVLPPTVPPQPTNTSVIPTATFTPTPIQTVWETQAIMFTPKMPNRLYALQRHHTDSEYRLAFSDDIGQSWQFLLNDLPVEPACLNNINLDYNLPNTFWASTCQGLYHWTGNTWAPVSSQPLGAVALVPEKLQTIWGTEPFGPTEVPIIRSDNGGTTWTPMSRYLSHTNSVANLLVDPLDTERLYAVIWPEYAGSYLRRGSANGQWTDLPTPLNNSPIDTGLAIDGSTGTLYVIVNSSQLWRSPNANTADINAIQWELVYDFGQDQRVELLGSGWRQGELALFINLRGDTDISSLHRSIDRGQTWSPLPVE